MSKNKTSPIWKIDKNDLQILLDNSNSFMEVILKIGMNPFSSNHRTLTKRIQIDDLSLERINENRSKKMKQHLKNIRTKKTPHNDLFSRR